MSIDIAIIGAGGYTGRELIAILKKQLTLRVVHISSEKYIGQKLESVFPNISGDTDLVFKSHNDAIPDDLPVFLATPDEFSLEKVPELLKEKRPFVDLSGAFRLNNKDIWERVYGTKHTSFNVMEAGIVYGLPEIFRAEIKKTKSIANPGCYPIASIIVINHLKELRADLISISIQASSGTSGAGGRVEGGDFAFTNVYENFRAYKILGHQHEPEIAQYAASGLENGIACPITFTPHLLPLRRGILSTIILHWKHKAPQDLEERFRELSKNELFIRFYDKPEDIELIKVQNTNYLDIGLRSRDNITVVVCALDNLVKGAAGQAIQNMNLILGLSESNALL